MNALALSVALFASGCLASQFDLLQEDVGSTAKGPMNIAPEMERLTHALAGEWSTEDIYEPSAQLPKGGRGHSRESFRIGPARQSLIEEYHSDGDAGKSWGIGIIWWDRSAREFRVTWCDSSVPDEGCQSSSQHGAWNGDAFEITNKHEVSGKTVFEKEVWTEIARNTFTQTLYAGDAPETLKPFLTIKAKRIGASMH